ncbi:hypothetical protein KJ780_03785 [Candidatus Micrarchaeota archaeon]|nr:hypothetical protein [Candidatus Micrarchaeota archaeon]
MKIHYSPVQSNRMFVSKVQGLPAFKKCEFVPLHERQLARTNQLREVKGRAAFIWGNGESHHESYFFTENRIRLKINVDGHSDTVDAPYISPASHMRFTRNNGVKILTSNAQTDFSLFLLDAKNALISSNGDGAALTIDCDAIPCFPALPGYVLREGGILPQDIVPLIFHNGNKITRLDIGALIEQVPEFNFAPCSLGALDVPEYLAVRQFIDYARDCKTLDDITEHPILSKVANAKTFQKTIDAVMNYAFNIYTALLEAFISS